MARFLRPLVVLAFSFAAACSSSSAPTTTDAGTCSSAKVSALGLGTGCSTCLESKCCAPFGTCEGDAACSTLVACIASCYVRSSDLQTCAMTTCTGEAGTTVPGYGEAQAVVECLIGSCSTTAECMR